MLTDNNRKIPTLRAQTQELETLKPNPSDLRTHILRLLGPKTIRLLGPKTIRLLGYFDP